MKYLSFNCHMEFGSPVRFNVNPLFMIRSVMGAALRHECCYCLSEKCPDCDRQKSCVYYQVFEGVRPDFLKGMRVQAYSLHQVQKFSFGSEMQRFDFRMTLYGDSITELYPYVYLAFYNVGRRGITRDRIPFSFSVTHTSSVADDRRSLSDSIESWSEREEDYAAFSGKIKIELKTPLRFQYKGHYGLDFSLDDFSSCLYRRMKGMLSVFGNGPVPCGIIFDAVKMHKENIHWQDYSHYSARQKDSMMLGGILGSIELDGNFSPLDMMILDFADRFSAGKNVVFGLGNVEVWKKERQ